jgi:hypothetical protein
MFYGKATPCQSFKLSANPPALCATQKGWRSSSKSPKRSQNYSSNLVPKFTGHADTNQGFIGITNRNPVLMSTKSAKKSSRKPKTQKEEASSQLIQMGMNP